MRKALALLLVVAMLCSMSGCGVLSIIDVLDDAAATTATNTTTTTSAVIVNATPATTATVRMTATTKAAEKAIWEKRYYVDEFDQPTSKWYVANINYFVGKFSNSATTDSTLDARILVDAEKIAFVLYEYGKYQVKNSYSRSNSYTVKMKDSSGQQYTLSGFIPSNGDRIYVTDAADVKTILNALKKSGEVQFVIYDTDRTIEQYKFSAKTGNFSQLIK